MRQLLQKTHVECNQPSEFDVSCFFILGACQKSSGTFLSSKQTEVENNLRPDPSNREPS